jgi:glycosyltransferase involved in cell wall biosynthesis
MTGTRSQLGVVLTPIPFIFDPRHSFWRSELDRKFESVEVWQFLTNGLDLASNKVGISVSVGSDDEDVLDLEASFDTSIRTISSYARNANDDASQILRSLIGQFSGDVSVTHKYLLGQVTRMTASLALASTTKFPALVIANDLVAAIAAVLVWPKGETRIIYDAQEVFTDMYRSSPADRMTDTEELFWLELETFVCRKVDEVVTISPGIAELYLERHGVMPFVIPNWVPLSSADFANSSRQEAKKFVYMGHAAPHRGLEELISQWITDKSIATLDLYIPERPYTQDLRKLIEKHQLDFPEVLIVLNDPVSESQMIPTLSRFDVGVIPYAHPYPYNHCSPNKLGQYLAAGLAIVANDLPFVKQTIEEARCGHTFNWEIPGSFNDRVSLFITDQHLDQLKLNAKTAFLSDKNWDAAIHRWDSETNALIPVDQPKVNEFWIDSFADIAVYPKSHSQVVAVVNPDKRSLKQAIVTALGKIGLRDSVRTRRIFARLSNVPVIGAFAKAVAKYLI